MTKTQAPSDAPSTEVPMLFEDRLKLAWSKYGTAIYVLCGLVAAGIAAKGGINYLAAQKELETQKEFSACTTDDAFKAFAEQHRGHPLGALVEMKIADEDYLTGKYPEAVTNYDKAVSDLPDGPFRSRAKLGFALSQARVGKTADAQANLKKILSDDSEYKSVRCEAGYNLAQMALAEGRKADVQALTEQLLQVDPTSPFAERAFALRSEMGAAPSGIAVPAGH